MSVVSVCLVRDFSIAPLALQCQLPALLFVCALFVLLLLYLFCLVNQSRTKGEGWSIADWFKYPSNFIAGRPKAALLFWFFGGF